MARILLVEDNEMNRDMLTRRLQKKGHEVTSAADAEEGITKAQASQPQIILMDMSLPGMDGLEATRRLKADSATAPIPVIVLTAHALEGDREKALASGCEEYDTKPVDMPRLLEKIERLTAGRAAT